MVPGSFNHSLGDVQQRTGLKMDFIYRANRMLAGILSNYRVYGSNNEVLFSGSGLMVWDRIKQLKESDKNLSEIADLLEKELPNTPHNPAETSETSSQTLPNRLHNRGGESSDSIEVVVKALADSFNKTDEARQSELATLRKMNEELEKRMLALPDGRTPEEIRIELERKTEKENELETLKETVSVRESQEKANSRKRQELYAELAGLSRFKTKEKNRIIEELKQLE